MTDLADRVTQSISISDDQKQQVLDKATEAKQQVRGQIAMQVGSRATQLGEQATTIAGAVRTASDQLEGQGQEAPARVLDTAADKADQLGQYLTTSDPNQILADVEESVAINHGSSLGWACAWTAGRTIPQGLKQPALCGDAGARNALCPAIPCLDLRGAWIF